MPKTVIHYFINWTIIIFLLCFNNIVYRWPIVCQKVCVCWVRVIFMNVIGLFLCKCVAANGPNHNCVKLVGSLLIDSLSHFLNLYPSDVVVKIFFHHLILPYQRNIWGEDYFLQPSSIFKFQENNSGEIRNFTTTVTLILIEVMLLQKSSVYKINEKLLNS